MNCFLAPEKIRLNKGKAAKRLVRRYIKTGQAGSMYKCKACSRWHLTSQKPKLSGWTSLSVADAIVYQALNGSLNDT
jgi:hypothetical protein